MQIEPIHIDNQNKLIRDYRDAKLSIMEHFDYGMLDFQKRVSEISSRTYNREQLAHVLKQLNEMWGATSATFSNIERLKEARSVVVVGGQQAGLLTGPLYSVNKVISIIQLARQQEKELGIPVIPVFWIAGEDHDFEEINHVYMGRKSFKKYKLPIRNDEKLSISQMDIDHKVVQDWLKTILNQISETKFTNELNNMIVDCLEHSNNYVDFFAQLIFRLFPEEGLVLIDSGNKQVRELESEYFAQMIMKQEEISAGVVESIEKLTNKGYTIDLDVSLESGNLFYHLNGERILLNKDAEGNWIGKQNEIILRVEEILHVAKQHPEQLSNNVITRPLMQDLLFPTLAFIGGPGEISYWSVLKSAFHGLGIKMPPVVPRLSFTYLEPKAKKIMQKYNIPIEVAVNHGVVAIRDKWFQDKMEPPVGETASQIKRSITEIHRPLLEIAEKTRSDVGELAHKNLAYLIRDIEFLEKRIENALKEKYHKELEDFSLLENLLHPDGLQERVWNPLPFLNEYGLDFFREICCKECSVEEEHFIIYL
ncbi:bacillithiol biosynthesis cysteine-adding enzyme BshC [Ornithinibacillus bavariensis]|uniref:bacillithiol biosynthesis cysteine-adding enzyme BshC n=1 Tax=Ornithinibacillus bavariensis TaxID=545502 RepID=UPI000EC6446A|nr:bacillithiol biosynthesis cysteine-adding enzyme BshC [Ornithinibacillus sp.]